MYKVTKWENNRLVERTIMGTSIGDALNMAGLLYDMSVISIEMITEIG